MRPLGRVRKIAYARPDRVRRITGATVYAANFTLDEMRQMEAFFRQPGWTKADRKRPAITQQTAQIGRDVGRKAAGELGLRLTDAPERPQVELAFRVHIRCFLPKRFDNIRTERSHLRPLLAIVAILAVGVLVKLNEAWLASAVAALLFLVGW